MPTLTDISDSLNTMRGRQFENAVSDAFTFLDLKSQVIETTEAESDVIIEATYAENPYYVVVECCVVDTNNQIPYEKLGQIRGNFTKYMDERRQRVFKTAYKLIVGKPEFSDPAKTNSEPDIALMKVSVLVELLQYHSQCHFSQDELETIFKMIGEVRSDHLVNNLIQPYLRKLNIYALIYISLLENPYSSHDSRKPHTSIEQVVGEVKAYAKLLKVSAVSDDEINNAVRDLYNPFLKAIEIRGNTLRLSSLPIDSIRTTGGQLGTQEHLERLRRMQSLP